MLSAVSGYYNGSHIVMDEEIHLKPGQKVIITVLGEIVPEDTGRKRKNLGKYMYRGETMFEGNAQDFVKELRADDRQ